MPACYPGLQADAAYQAIDTRQGPGTAEKWLPWHAGLAMSTYEGSERLKDFFVVTSLSSDKRGAVYISTMEARKVGELKPYLSPQCGPAWHCSRSKQ